ncbi:cation acetate symporter [Kitasatospora sp. NE20-6]|uniref:sodium:solute symporter family transporter n=1 Tax=Kitasatospora sp. NE20-6 TaxID=2859066 RepID=UPI0034DC3C06
MTTPTLLAGGDYALVTPLTAFLVVICLCFLLCLIAGVGNDTTADFYTAERSLPALRNSLALCGDHIPATALLSPIGTVALTGYDGMATAASASASMVLLLVLAEPLRNTGRFTLGSVLATRTAGRAARIAGAVTTVAVCVPLTVVQLTVAGEAIAYVLDTRTPGAALVCTVLSGLLVITFAAFGGMRGTSMIQTGKALLVFGVVAAAALASADALDWDPGALMERAAIGSGGAATFHAPGLLFGTTATGSLERFSLCLTVSLGSAVVPPLLMRVGASVNGRAARRASGHATVMVGLFHSTVVLLGLAAAAIVGVHAIATDDPQGNSALLLLTDALDQGTGGRILFTAVACAVFVTALASVAGLALAGAASLSHDVHAGVLRRGRATDKQELTVAQWAIVALGAVAVLLAALLRGWSILFLASFAAAVAASVILPALVHTLFWPGYSRLGMLWTLYGSLACCLLLQVFGPTVSGQPYSLFPGVDFHWFPLQNIAVVSVPVGFLLGWAGSRLRPPTPPERAADAEAATVVLVGTV